MMKLSEHLNETMQFVEAYVRDNQYAPSVSEMAQAFGMETLETLQARVEALEQLNGLLLEMVHQMVNDYHAPKAHWERKMIPAWKAHIEKKRQAQQQKAPQT